MFVVECDHLERCDGGFGAFVAVYTSAAGTTLLNVVVGQHTEDGGCVVRKIELGNSVRHAVTDKIKMAGFALDHASNNDDGIRFVRFVHFLGAKGQFNGPGHIDNEDVVGFTKTAT